MDRIIRIPNIEMYTLQIVNGDLILTPREKFVSDDEINNISLTSSTILNCTIESAGHIFFYEKMIL